MTAPAPNSANSLPLVEVGRLCADIAGTSEDLAGVAANCMLHSGVGPHQRHYAAACDRHAWHRELAIDRSPRIPLVPPIERPPIEGGAIADTGADPVTDRERMWRTGAAALRDRLLATYPVLHPELDPATARLIQLVVSDLDELLQELSDRAS